MKIPDIYKKIILFLLFVWMVINFFPGSYSVDSWYQYFKMSETDYDDWHSPWMAYLWRLLFVGTHWFFGLYLLQMAWYYTFYYYLVKRVDSIVILIIGILSSIGFVFMPQYVMKDSLLALVWGSAALILLYSDEQQPRYAKYLAMALMVYGLFLRPNTLPALLPFLFLYIECYSSKPLTVLRKTLLTLGLSVLLLGAYYVLTYSVFNTRRAFPEYKLKLMDVIGISKLSGEDYMPECITSFKGYNRDTVLKLYSPATIDHIYWPATGSALIPAPTGELDRCLFKAWKQAIFDHPWFYFKNRTSGFLNYLRFRKRLEWHEYWNATVYIADNKHFPIEEHRTVVTEKLVFVWAIISRVHFYDPWVWLCLNLVFFGWFVFKYIREKTRTYKILAALQLSGILYTLGMLPVFQVDRDFRYTYWNIFVFMIGAIYYFGVKLPGEKKK